MQRPPRSHSDVALLSLVSFRGEAEESPLRSRSFISCIDTLLRRFFRFDQRLQIFNSLLAARMTR
jgi:hypothetical protein